MKIISECDRDPMSQQSQAVRSREGKDTNLARNNASRVSYCSFMPRRKPSSESGTPPLVDEHSTTPKPWRHLRRPFHYHSSDEHYRHHHRRCQCCCSTPPTTRWRVLILVSPQLPMTIGEETPLLPPLLLHRDRAIATSATIVVVPAV